IPAPSTSVGLRSTVHSESNLDGTVTHTHSFAREMKRLAFALLCTMVCAPAVVAQDVTTQLYGDFRYSYNRADAGDSTYWASANNASRLGVRADVAGEYFTVFADLQTGINIDRDSAGGVF